MCQSNVYFRKGGEEALLMEDVARIGVEGSHIHQKSLHARLADANLVEHTIVLEPVAGMPHDFEELIRRAVDLHGHLGPYLVFGIRMGLLAKKKLGYESPFDVKVKAFVGLETPVSCMADGLQFGSGATLGKRNIELVEMGDGPPRARFECGGRSIDVALTQTALDLTGDMPDRHHLDDIAMKAAGMSDDELFVVSE